MQALALPDLWGLLDNVSDLKECCWDIEHRILKAVYAFEEDYVADSGPTSCNLEVLSLVAIYIFHTIKDRT